MNIHKLQANCGLYYKHMVIVNYTSSIINELKALLTDDARVIIYDRHVFIVQAAGDRGEMKAAVSHYNYLVHFFKSLSSE
jgi:hypothetical protein